MDNKQMILIIEDEKVIRNFTKIALETQGYKVIEAVNGQEALTMIMSYNPELIILDLGLPDMDGLKILEYVREWSNTPIIIVSARGQERDKITALDLGADDYLTKPFSMAELLARVRVALRRISLSQDSNNALIKNYKVQQLEVDLEKRKIMLAGEEVHLTPIEFKIFSLLVKNSGKVLTHNYITKEVWGGVVGNENQSLRVFMANIRRKIEKEPANPRYLITEVGVGYRLVDE